MDFTLIYFPQFYGSDRYGTHRGPSQLINDGLISKFNVHNLSISQENWVSVISINEEDKYNDHPQMKYYSAVLDSNQQLKNYVFKAHQNASFPIVIGGDHSLGIGSVAGTSEYFGENIGIVWVDAHTDINTIETSPSHNIHGMPLAASIGILEENFNKIGKNIHPQNIFYIGARSIDEGELELCKKLGVHLWTMSDIHEKGLDTVLTEFTQALSNQNIKDIHFSFDIDSLDDTLVPGTGTPVKDGLSLIQSEAIISTIFNTNLVRTLDIVEYNPVLDINNITKQSVDHILEIFFSHLTKMDD